MGRRWTKVGPVRDFAGCLRVGRPRQGSGGTQAATTPFGNDPARTMCEPPIRRDATKRARSGALMPILFEQN